MDSVFPKRTGFYNRFLTFRNASTREIDDWKNALVFFVRKLTFRYGGRPIVLKSPAHTSRIRMILDIFPDAKFVLIHRNPFEVYLSYMHMLHKYLKGYGLNKLDETVASNHTILVYREMINAFFEEKHFIPEANYHEIRYDDLINDPSGELQKAYEKLALPDFKEYESDLKAYLSTIADYKKNELPNLPGDLQEKLFVEWKRYFTEWNYPMKVSEPKE